MDNQLNISTSQENILEERVKLYRAKYTEDCLNQETHAVKDKLQRQSNGSPTEDSEVRKNLKMDCQ